MITILALQDVIGIDLGLKTLAMCSDGKKFTIPRKVKDKERKIRELKKIFYTFPKNSADRECTKIEIGTLVTEVSNQRRIIVDKLMKWVTVDNKPAAVVIEDLSIDNMKKNTRLSKYLAAADFGHIRSILSLRCDLHDVRLIVANRWFPSSKMCSKCKKLKKRLKLKDRVYNCGYCKLSLDRDLNAALNLQWYGKQILDGIDPSDLPGGKPKNTRAKRGTRIRPVRPKKPVLKVSPSLNQKKDKIKKR